MHLFLLIPCLFFCLLFSFCSLREQEQNECKFYNELGQFLVKDFTPVPQMNKMTEEYDDDFSAFSQQDTGLYCHLHVIGGKGRNWLWWFKVYLYKESLNYIIWKKHLLVMFFSFPVSVNFFLSRYIKCTFNLVQVIFRFYLDLWVVELYMALFQKYSTQKN